MARGRYRLPRTGCPFRKDEAFPGSPWQYRRWPHPCCLPCHSPFHARGSGCIDHTYWRLPGTLRSLHTCPTYGEPTETLYCRPLSYFKSDVRQKTDRKSTRLNSSHVRISYAVFCLKKKK